MFFYNVISINLKIYFHFFFLKSTFQKLCALKRGLQLTFPSDVLFSTQISSEGLTAGVPDAGMGGIPGGKSIPGGGGKLLIGGGRKGGLWSKR